MIFVANTLKMNGGTTFLRRISKTFSDAGHKVLIILLQEFPEQYSAEDYGGGTKIVNLRNFCIEAIPNLPYSTVSIFFPLDKSKLRKAVEEYGHHIHVMGIFGLFFGLRVAGLIDSVRLSAGIYHQNEYFLRGKSTGIARQMIRQFKKLPAKNLIFFNEHCVAEYSKVMATAYLPDNVVPIGVDPVKTSLDFKPKPFRIVSIGNLNGFKTYNGHVTRLVASLKNRFPLVHYDVYGDGPERESLVALAASLGVADQVTFHGRIPYHEFQSIVSTAFVFVGSGTAVLEAAMLGVPAIVGIESIAEPETYGFIFECEGYTYNEFIPSRSTVPIEQKLVEVFEARPEAYAYIGDRCREKAREFTIDKTFEGFLRVERGLLSSRGHLRISEYVLFAYWLVVTGIFDLLRIDRSFRFRRDLT